MEPNFEEILKKWNIFYDDEKSRRCIEAMQEVWNIAVDKCAEEASTESILHPKHGYVFSIVDKQSILKLKLPASPETKS